MIFPSELSQGGKDRKIAEFFPYLLQIPRPAKF